MRFREEDKQPERDRPWPASVGCVGDARWRHLPASTTRIDIVRSLEEALRQRSKHATKG